MKLKSIFFACLGLLLMTSMVHAQDTDFDTLDTDSDGKVSKDEFQEYAETKLAGFAKLDEFVDKVDANEDDEISEDEFANRMNVLGTLAQPPEEEELDEETKKKRGADFAAATDAYETMSGLVEDGKWEDVAEMMTKQACDDYVYSTVIQGVAVVNAKLPRRLDTPALSNAKEAMTEVLEEFGLSDLDVESALSIRVEVDGKTASDDKEADEKEDKDDDKLGSGDKDDDKEAKDDDKKKMTAEEKAEATQKALRKQVMELVDKDDKRWEIVQAIRKAREGSPFDRRELMGEVNGSDYGDGDVFLTVTRKSTPSGGRVSNQPPMVVKMTRNDDGEWQYDGVDQVRTNAKLRSFMQQMRQQLQRRGGRFTEDDF